MSNRFTKKCLDDLIHIEETPTVLIIGNREANPIVATGITLVALVILALLIITIMISFDSWLLRILLVLFFILPLAFGSGYFLRMLALPRCISLNKGTGMMIVEKPVALRRRRYEYTLDQIQEVRCRYISKGTEIKLSIAMTSGEEIIIFEDVTIGWYGYRGAIRLQITKHEIPLRIAAFLGVPYKKIFRGSADSDERSGDIEVIYPEESKSP